MRRIVRRSVGPAAFALWAAISATGVLAATVNFNERPFNPPPGPGGNITPRPDTVVADQYRDLGLLFGREGVSAGVAVVQTRDEPGFPADIGVAALDAGGEFVRSAVGGIYVSDTYFRFVLPGTETPAVAEGVSFRVGDGGGDIDMFEIRSYDLDGRLVDTQSFADTVFRTITVPTAIHRVEIDFTGDRGYIVDDIRFTVVPEPAAVALVLLPAAALLRRGRRNARRRWR